MVVGTVGFSTGEIPFISLAIDSSGTPYVAYQDMANGNKATVMEYSGGSWVVVGTAGFSAGGLQFLSLAIDSSGTPYVAYQDESGAGGQKATVMKYSGGSWVVVGTVCFSAGVVEFTSLAIDSSGTPYAAYQDVATSSWKATVMKYSGGSWVVVGAAGFSAGEVEYTSLAMFHRHSLPRLCGRGKWQQKPR